MSSLQKDPSGNFHICFRFSGKRFKRSLRTKNERQAAGALTKLNERLWMLENGHLEIPSDVEHGEFLIHGRREIPKPPAAKVVHQKSLSLEQLFDEYFVTANNGSLERSTVSTLEIHRRHLERVLGKSFASNKLTPKHLQDYINKRSKAKGKYGRPLCGSTIRKELVTLRTVWNWANELELVEGKITLKKLRFPKSFERLPFQTRSQIEELIKNGKLNEVEVAEMWEALFLVKSEVQTVLKLIETNATVEFLYPMISIAAHAGVRRSELLRMKLDDIRKDLLIVRERKRVRGEMSTRFVPMTSQLKSTLAAWKAKHPGGEYLFVNDLGIQVTKDVAHKQLKRTLKLADWSCIKGFHVFRHSFISALAIDGVDQRIIDEIVGHTTEQQRRRYRHLTPDITARAVESVFGSLNTTR
jgi:integrase